MDAQKTPGHPSSGGGGSASPTLWLTLATLVVVSDQLIKWLILGHYRLGDVTRVTGFFNIVRAHNTGAAFSFLASAGGWQRWLLAGVALAVAIFIVWMLRAHPRQKLFALSLSLILGGAVGNLIDRVVHGYVVDFLDFHWNWLAPMFRSGHFPAFNLADSAITAGAIGLILDELRRVRRS
ncbi:MAG: signal peptidase II [Burkholderiaceae bacterium]|jgi:signal peptidase II|nr:signal peptidase II [Burkholderiaceae bacterium]